MTSGEDAVVYSIDLREERPSKLVIFCLSYLAICRSVLGEISYIVMSTKLNIHIFHLILYSLKYQCNV